MQRKSAWRSDLLPLKVHEPTETELDDLSIRPLLARQEQPKRRHVLYEAQDNDARFVVLCYFADLRSIREFIQKTWED